METKKEEFKVQTPLGELVVYASTDRHHPGVYIDLRRYGSVVSAPVAMVEYSNDDADVEGEHLITRTWDNCNKENYGTRVVHEGVEDFFKEEG